MRSTRNSLTALMLFIAVPVIQPASPVARVASIETRQPVPLIGGKTVSNTVSGIMLREMAVLNQPATQETIEGWELVSEKKKDSDGSESVTAYPRTVINNDIDNDGAVETVTVRTFLEMNTTLQTFQTFRIHFRADVSDPGPVQDPNLILEAAKSAGGINLLELCSIALPNQGFYDPSMDYRYYLNDDSVFFVKGMDSYRPARIEATADVLTWNYPEDSILLTFTRKTFTSASIEDLVK